MITTQSEPITGFNPADRSALDFVVAVPSVLDVAIAKIKWILSIEVFTDGIDLSHWNWTEGREPDFGIIKANEFDFVIFKATQGTWFKDDKFEPGWMAALDNDLVTMLYHFFEGRTGGAAQAHYCIEYAKDYLKAVDGKTIFWDDIEKSYGEDMGQRQRRAHAFNQTIVEEGFLTGNYSSPSLWKLLMGSVPLPWINDYYQWVAHWTPAPAPTLPIGWTKEMCKWWQYGIWPKYSWAKKVGTNGNVDVVRFYGTIQDMKKILGINSPIPPDCCEEIKKSLAEVVVELASLNDRIHGVDQRAIERDLQTDLALDQHILLIRDEISTLKGKVSYIDSNQDAMQKQLDFFLGLLGDIKNLLP
jgi:GH25 family lysozyme M1 (1,4-beta-N-acetylmuramidase)